MTLVSADLVFAEDRWRHRHAFVMQGGTILATGEPGELAAGYPDHERDDWGEVAVLPGTVNGHAHSFQALLRGFGDDLPFMSWRDNVLYPFSERLEREDIKTGALLAFAEMVKAGVTTVVDFFYLHDRGTRNDLAVVEAAAQVGVRVVLARSMYDWAGAPRRYQETPREAQEHFRELWRALAGDSRAFAQPAPHSIHAASPDMLRAGAALADEFDLPFHIHVAEGRYEREQSIERTGLSPVAFLDSLEVLSDRTVMVHCVWVDDHDLGIMAERGVKVVHNPSANAFLGDGIAPVPEMLDRGVRVALGPDGGCANNRQSVFDEMRTATLVAKARLTDGSALDAPTALRLGTRGGAGLLGLPAGSLAAGCFADVVVLDLTDLSLQPPGNLERLVVSSMQPSAVARVMVGGEVVVEGGRPLRFDLPELRARISGVTGAWTRP